MQDTLASFLDSGRKWRRVIHLFIQSYRSVRNVSMSTKTIQCISNERYLFSSFLTRLMHQGRVYSLNTSNQRHITRFLSAPGVLSMDKSTAAVTDLTESVQGYTYLMTVKPLYFKLVMHIWQTCLCPHMLQSEGKAVNLLTCRFILKKLGESFVWLSPDCS